MGSRLFIVDFGKVCFLTSWNEKSVAYLQPKKKKKIGISILKTGEISNTSIII